MRVYEFFIQGTPNPKDLEGVEEDQLLEIQRTIQEKLKERDAERERNISKRMKQYEQKYDFINKALLESVAQITEMTKSDHPMTAARVISADKMVMLPPLFDGTKPEVVKQHYERFNQYIKFQTKSGNIRDPVGEAIELFEHTLDKKALVWFQEHKDKFVDLTTLKTMFFQKYNPWGKTQQDQLQSWNILVFDPQKMDIDEHTDLINTLGDILGQTAEPKMEKFTDTMPTIIQIHLSPKKNLGKDKMINTIMKILTIIIIMRIIEANLEDIDPTEAKIQVNSSEAKICVAEVNEIRIHTKANIKTMAIKAIITKAIEVFIITHAEIFNRVIIMANLEAEAMAEAEAIIMAMVMAGPIIEVILTTNTISIMVMMMSTRQINMVHHVHYAVATTILLNIALRESMISMTLWKR